jgi:NADPH:quinone reductase-like Zn-dependent oxidoreductase
MPTPKLGPTGSDVVIQIHIAALNPADVHLLHFLPSRIPFFRRSPIPGVDFAGTVVRSSVDVPSDFTEGAEVCGVLTLGQSFSGQGTLAEYVRLPAAVLALKPKEMSWVEAAGCGLTGQTVNTFLKAAKGLIGEGKRVLINGASGGIGTVLVQRVKAEGAVVVGVCSEGNFGLVTGLGADEVSTG